MSQPPSASGPAPGSGPPGSGDGAPGTASGKGVASTTPIGGVPAPAAVEAGTRFGFNLYRGILKTDAGKNVFVSPASVSMALSMAANGAGGTTREAMLKALAVQGLSIDELNRSNAGILGMLQNPDAKVTLTIANSLWARKGIPFRKSFLDLNREFYHAEVSDLDFQDPGSTGVINRWVSDATQGKIPTMIDRIQPDDIMFLLNAIYFKGTWTVAFEKKATAEKPFTLKSGSVASVPMMSQSGRYRYLKGDGFQAVSLPYGKERVSMYLFLPDQAVGLDGFHRSLDAENWSSWMSGFRQQQGSVVLPRFRMKYEIQLNDPLSAMGMAEAFDPRKADFTGLLDAREVFISQVKHKTFVEVNEEGTEAAAATSIGISVTSVQPNTPFHLVFDRPFFCAIRDNESGAILFMGSIQDPR
jgi:serpin B